MKNTERFHRFFQGEISIDRTPVIEWAMWWDKTVNNWHNEGLPRSLTEITDICDFWGQDQQKQFWFAPYDEDFPKNPDDGKPASLVKNEEDYAKVKKYLYTDRTLEKVYQEIKTFLKAKDGEDYAVWYSLEGFFWLPRVLFGIEDHLYAFFDYPDLMEEINRDLADYYQKVLDAVYSLLKPQFMTFLEDMSYNHGPMLSKAHYDALIHPFYRELIPVIKGRGTRVFIDTDGFVEPLIPWFLESGIEGILPLERMAGVNVGRIRENFPALFMIGGFDKTVMHKGEQAMRAEFERILPVIKSGRYIPSVDHQTPPDVDMQNYRVFMDLLFEYSGKIGKS